MGKLLVVVLTLITIHVSHGVPQNRPGNSGEGDPAPGRSPGPPLNNKSHHEINELQTQSQHINLCDFDGNDGLVEVEEGELLDFNLTHHLFNTDLIVPGITYNVVLRSSRDEEIVKRSGVEFRISSSLSDSLEHGTFVGPHGERPCNQGHVFKGLYDGGESLTLNWTLGTAGSTIKTNVTFTLRYNWGKENKQYERTLSVPIALECQLWLRPGEKLVTWRDFPAEDCQVWFPGHNSGHGIVIEMSRLNIPCSKGFVHFSGLNASQYHFRSHKQAHLCGKLEELPESDRHIYFPSSHVSPFMHVHGNPVFSLSYHLVDYCYNVTFASRNGSFELKPSTELECTFRIYLPFGNRVAITLNLGESAGKSDIIELKSDARKCEGLQVQLFDGNAVWSHCSKSGDPGRRIELVSRENKVMLKVSVRGTDGTKALGMRMNYRAEPMAEIVGLCGFGWIAMRQFCISAVENNKLPWAQAEIECARRGGHLASIRNEHAQKLIDSLLMNSPGYKDNNAYWIGASDAIHESDFRWSDGLPFSYSNWFHGWPQHGDYNRQPNDDGLSEQDCVEVRRIYALPTSHASLTSGFMWNDRDCSTPNYFICERLQNDEPLEESWPPDCNRTVILSRQQPRAAISSPGFPRHYPDNSDCETEIIAPPGYRLLLDFEELVLENEPSCSYDFLEIMETVQNATNHTSNRRLCGDWSLKLKLLRHVSNSSKLRLRFSSDYSNHFSGYKVRVSMENALQCSDDRLQIFNNSCYLFVSYPEVMWSTAQQICKGISAQLASVLSPEEERFITTNIRKMAEYRNSARYWLGGRADITGRYSWIDGKNMGYLGWLPGQKPVGNREGGFCLGMQWTTTPTPMLPSGLYWKSLKCNNIGGYVCKRPTLISGQGINFNKTVNGNEGKLVTPNYPGNYYNNLDFTVRIIGPERTRIVVIFEKLDLESQVECLYDYIELRSVGKNGRYLQDVIKWCGTHDSDLKRFNFVSETNEAQLRFHSDFSITGGGFAITWHSVDVSGCPTRTLTAKEGVLTTPNYPHFLLPKLDCTFTVTAPLGKRVWLTFEHVDIGDGFEKYSDDEIRLEIKLGDNSITFKPFQIDDLLTEGTFVSSEEKLKIRLRTKNKPNGIGFKATYKTVSIIDEEKVVNLSNNSTGALLHLNYPDTPPYNIDFTQHFVAPLGHIIYLELYHVYLNENSCDSDMGVIDVFDNYADVNGTSWHLCYDYESEADSVIPKAPIAINSFLNTLHLRQKCENNGFNLNGTLKVVQDVNFMNKILKHRSDVVESCYPNPCLHEGKCVHNGTQKLCQCLKYYTGIFCALTKCDLEPCVFGSCQLTNSSYKCHCKNGYMGPTCEQKKRPCEGNPCESRGSCIEKGDNFICRCHAWWEGTRCERRMLHIPYKPLSERMLREPFWLGLMTVSVVMGVIGLVWCAKRHFPEKIEKLLAEEEDRNRGGISSLRSASVREQLAASGAAAVTVTPSPGPGAPRSLFGRLGIRKPSILSLTSPHASGYSPATARTFSLDDLLKPPPRRTPSPKKKRNNSTPTKKNAAEKKQILQQLISPNTKQVSGKVSLGELMQLSDRQVKDGKQLHSSSKSSDKTKETKFMEPPSSAQITLTDPKLEKKVTFARLLSKVSAEMSSGSEMELGIMQTNILSCAFARPSSTPPSPGANARSPNSTSSNQGSDSLTSSDLAIPSALSSSISDFGYAKRKFNNSRQKPTSADSILAMFRNFSSSTAGVNLPSSLKVTPSSTPTASTPQDDVAGDDDSSTSSIYTPISFSSAPPESPVMHRSASGGQNTIEVSVLDTLSAHKSSNSGSNFLHPPTILLEIPSTINKCLSPIREMPTPLPSPMPSPAITPIMRRSAASSIDEQEFSDDRISVELPNISVSYSDEDDSHPVQDILIDPQAEDGFILEEAAAMQKQPSSKSLLIKNRPPPLGQALTIPTICVTSLNSPTEKDKNQQRMIIPTLTIQTPSPTHSPYPLLPGSPPPRTGTSNNEEFKFPPAKQNRKMLKEFDKPTSLDLPCAPPMITITCNMSEVESDAESISPNKNATLHLPPGTTGMTYLSPFSMVTRGDHNASESNLSSSGYSSMASPGPSRCGSSNPLCPSEMDDSGPPGPGSHPPLSRRPSPLLKSSIDPESSNKAREQQQQRGRSDSETLSDDILLESNDEGIGTDHLEEKIEDGELKSAKELEVFMSDNTKLQLELPLAPISLIKCPSVEKMDLLLPPGMKTLQPPSIIIHSESNNFEKLLSPVSSRSESPLSDRTTGVHRFSTQFYGRNKDILPFTDSDGLYDFPSSDKVNVANVQTHRKSGRKREKKLTRQSKTPSPTKAPNCYHLELPFKATSPRKPSPKRRSRTPQVINSSSSSDSIATCRDLKSSSSPSPDTIRWAASLEWPNSKSHRSPEASAEETGDEANSAMLPKSEPELQKNRKISRLRAISHQIRFLRRVELSLKRRERTISPPDSVESEEDIDLHLATSPLLQAEGPRIDIKKSSSIGKLQTSSSLLGTRNRRGRLRRSEYLTPEDKNSWKRAIAGGSGYSD